MNNQLLHSGNNSIAVLPVVKKTLSKMLPEERYFIEAAFGPKINEINPEAVEVDFVPILTKAFTIAGQHCDAGTLALYAGEIKDRLLRVFPNITIAEAKAAIEAGVYGNYGDYYGLNPKSFIGFIEAYLKSSDRREAKKLFEEIKMQLGGSGEMPPEQKIESNKEFVNYLFNQYLNGKLIVDLIPSFLYDFMVEQKLIALTTDEKFKYIARARSYHTRLKSSHSLASSPKDELLNLTVPSSPEFAVKVLAKCFIIWDCFEVQKAAGKVVIFEINVPGVRLVTN
jgi:hypothetical protein